MVFLMANGRTDFLEELKTWFTHEGRVVIAGIGNPIRMDDFVGMRIVQVLQGRVSGNVMLIECETVPESFMQQIIDFKPAYILLIDAAILNLKPGEARLLEPGTLRNFHAVSTHTLPLRTFCDYVVKATNAGIRLLLIQPKYTDFGEGLSEELEASALRISAGLLKVLP
jgi:hydrogenase 3 maturation protease